MVGGSGEGYTGGEGKRGGGETGLLTPLFILRVRASESLHPVRPLYARFRGQNLRNVRGWNPFVRFFNCKKDPPGSRGGMRGGADRPAAQTRFSGPRVRRQDSAPSSARKTSPSERW